MDPFALTQSERVNRVSQPFLHAAMSAFIWGSGQLVHQEKRKATVFFGGQLVTLLYSHDFLSTGPVYTVMTSHFGNLIYGAFFSIFLGSAFTLWVYNVLDSWRIASFAEMIAWRTIALEIEPEVTGWDFNSGKNRSYRPIGPWTVLLYLLAFAALTHLMVTLASRGSQDSLLAKIEANPRSIDARIALVQFYLSKGRAQHARLEVEDYLKAYGDFLTVNDRDRLLRLIQPANPEPQNAQSQSVAMEFMVEDVLESGQQDWVKLSETLEPEEFEAKALKQIRHDRSDLKPVEVLLNRYMEQKDWQRVEELASDALRHHPHTSWLIQSKLMAENRLRQEPPVIKPDFSAAVKLYREGSLEAAETELINYFERGGADKEAFLLQNAISFQQKDYQEAVRHLENALKHHPQDFLFLYSMGNAWLRMEQYQNAIQWFEKIVQTDPSRKDVYKNLGLAYRKAGNRDESIKNYRRAVELDPEDQSVLFLLGYAELENEQYPESAATLQNLLSKNPKHPLCAFYLGQAQERAGLPKEAIKAYELVPPGSNFRSQADTRIAELREKSRPLPVSAPIKTGTQTPLVTDKLDALADALENAEKLWKADNREEAVRQYRRVLELEPEHFRSLSQIGRYLLEDQADYGQAREHLLKARRLKADDIWVNLSLGVIAKYQNASHEAIGYFEEVLRRDPSQLNANFNLALLYEDKNQLDLAKDYYNRVIRFHPRHLLAYNYLGDIYFNEGDYSRASETYQSLLAMSPDNSGIRFKLALSLEKEGNVPEAQKELQALLPRVSNEPLMLSEVQAAIQRLSSSRP